MYRNNIIITNFIFASIDFQFYLFFYFWILEIKMNTASSIRIR